MFLLNKLHMERNSVIQFHHPGDTWINACYLLADSFLQLCDSLGIIFIDSFL